MSERENKAFGFTGGEIYDTAREMIGPYRVEPLSVFSTEEHLQRKYNSFVLNPNTLTVNRSEIIGGTALLKLHDEELEKQYYLQEIPDKVHRVAALNRFFNVGFGLVERTVVSHRLGFENEMISPHTHKEWAETPQEERMAEMHAYLTAQDAPLLARNLLEGPQQGSMMEFVSNMSVLTSRVTGGEAYKMDASTEPAARDQITEGVLAALYLLREHQVAQELQDMDKLFAPPESEPEPELEQEQAIDTSPPEKEKGTPPEAPPGYY